MMKIVKYPKVSTPYGRVRKISSDDIQKFVDQKISELELRAIIFAIANNDIRQNSKLYLHVANSGDVFDIGPNESGSMSSNSINYMNKAIQLFRTSGFIDSSNSFFYQEFPGEEAFHFVIR